MNVQTDLPQRRFHLRGAVGGRQLMQRCVILERFADCEERVIPGALWDIGEPWWHVVSRYLFAEPCDGASVRAQQTGETKQESGFTGAGPSDEADDLAGVNVERDIAQCGNGHRTDFGTGEVGLVQTSDRQCELHRSDPPRRCARTFASLSLSWAIVGGPPEALHRAMA